MAVSDWSVSAASNTSVGGVTIGEGMARSDVNNMGRAIMAEAKGGFVEAVSVLAHGADTASADNTAAFRAALTALSDAGGGVLNIPHGSYNLASASLTTPLTVPANTTIIGNGSTLTITGSTECYVFRATNVSNVTIEGLNATGNSQASVVNNGSFFDYYLTDAASTTNKSNILIRDCHLSNFKATWWISFQNNNTLGAGLQHAHVRDCSFTSATGNSIDPASITYHAHAVAFDGNPGIIKDSGVDHLTVHANHMKGGVIFFHKVTDSRMDNVTVYQAGVTGANDDKAGYAIMCYDDTATMARITITNPILNDPRSAGIYLARGTDITVINPHISGQTDASDATLPKGAIAVNGTTRFKLVGGIFRNNEFDVSLVAEDTANTAFDASIQGIDTAGADEASILVQVGTGTWTGLEIVDCRLDSDVKTIDIRNNAASYIGGIVLERNEITVAASSFGIDFYGLAITCPADRIRIANNRFLLNSAGATAMRPRACTGWVTIEGNEFWGVGGSIDYRGIQAPDSTKLVIDNNRFFRFGVGIAIQTTDGGVFQQKGNSFHDSASATIANAGSAGLAIPTHSGTQGEYIQNLDPDAGEHEGWICVTGTTWHPTGPIRCADAYSPTNVTPDRAYDADTVAVAELADVVGTLIADLKLSGVLT